MLHFISLPDPQCLVGQSELYFENLKIQGLNCNSRKRLWGIVHRGNLTVLSIHWLYFGTTVPLWAHWIDFWFVGTSRNWSVIYVVVFKTGQWWQQHKVAQSWEAFRSVDGPWRLSLKKRQLLVWMLAWRSTSSFKPIQHIKRENK